MIGSMSSNPLTSWFMSFASKLSFPRLFTLLAVLFALDLVVPDFVPLADELMLGLLTLLVGSIKKREAPPADPPIKNITPPEAR